MRRASVSIDVSLEEPLERYLAHQEVKPPLAALVQTALLEFLRSRGYVAPPSPLKITPAPQGSGEIDISQRHDEYLAGS
ncbi:MAG: hypothetical protein NTV70_26380 [Acidobacteria bacterium]|nr:hypothetical protein [Acidobacteriota bacterium]